MTELAFTQEGTQYKCSVGQTKGIVQVEFQWGGAILSVSANLPSMKQSVISTLQNPYSTSIIFELNVEDGLEVTLTTSKPVVKALIM